MKKLTGNKLEGFCKLGGKLQADEQQGLAKEKESSIARERRWPWWLSSDKIRQHHAGYL